MDLFLLLKSDNRIDNQLKVDFLRKKRMKPVGKSLPPKQTEEGSVCVCKYICIFLPQKSRSWSWGSHQAGFLDQRGSFGGGPAHHVHREISARAERLRHLHCTQTCCQHPGAKFTPAKAWSRSNQHLRSSISISGWRTPAVFHAVPPALSSYHKEWG